MRRAVAIAQPRFVAVVALWTAIGAGCGLLLLALAGPVALGHQSFTVVSGSMEPALGTGDVVVVKKISPLESQVGDIITFKDPRGSARLITHRLRKVEVRGRTARMVTKGDANNAVERWSVAPDGQIGRVAYRVPKLGFALAWARNPHGKLLLIGVPTALFALFELIGIWRPHRAPEATPETS